MATKRKATAEAIRVEPWLVILRSQEFCRCDEIGASKGGPPETTATLCVDEQAARALAEELKDDVLKDQPARSDALATPDGGWSFRMGDCRAGAIACVERSSSDNGFIHQLDEYVVFKGFECVVVKPMSAAAAREKTHALPKPDDSAGINQKLRKR